MPTSCFAIVQHDDLWYIPYSNSKQCTCTYCLYAGVFHLTPIPTKKKYLSLSLPLFPSRSDSHSNFPILPSLFLRFQCGKCNITPTITMALYVSQNKVGLSLPPSLCPSLRQTTPPSPTHQMLASPL